MAKSRQEYMKPFLEKRERVRRMLASGLSQAEVSRALKISRQRVSQLAQVVCTEVAK